MLHRYFIFDTTTDPLLWAEHDPWLVALSLLVAMGGASVAMHLADLASKARLGREREWTLASGAVALGSSIWTMHYIGMLAFGVCGEANFDSWMTVLSILPGLAASWVGGAPDRASPVGPTAVFLRGTTSPVSLTFVR